MHIETGTWRRVLGAALLGAALAAAGLAPVVAANDATVKIHDFAFGPAPLTVKAGTTVTWINEDETPHTVVATAHAFRSKALDTDDKYSFTFTTPGSYAYFCSLHPHMQATVVVTQ
jgi:plastocyanin